MAKTLKEIMSQEKPEVVKKAKTNYALANAKVALLKSQIALKIDNSKQKAEAELDNAINYLSEAKLTADEKTKAEIDLLIIKLNIAKKSLVQKKIDALEKEYHDKELHKIRISFKKLRYLMEEFQHIFGEKKIEKMIYYQGIPVDAHDIYVSALGKLWERCFKGLFKPTQSFYRYLELQYIIVPWII